MRIRALCARQISSRKRVRSLRDYALCAIYDVQRRALEELSILESNCGELPSAQRMLTLLVSATSLNKYNF